MEQPKYPDKRKADTLPATSIVAGLAFSLLLITGGCQHRPERVEAPSWDPSGIADRVIEELDSNGNSVVESDELTPSSGLAYSFNRIDKNGDEQLSKEEIRERFELYEKLGTGLVSRSFQVLLNGRPLPDAQIKFVPEEFQGGVIVAASGITDVTGMVTPQAEGRDLPAMQVGFYRAEIDDDRILANSAKAPSTVGIEVSPVSELDESGDPVLRFEM